MIGPAVFFIRCQPGGTLFYAVEVYETEAQMHRAASRMVADDGFVDQAAAICVRYVSDIRDGEKLVVGPEIGTLFFTYSNVSDEVVLHEVAHAALYWARRTGVDVHGPGEDNGEEAFVEVVQNLFAEFKSKAPEAIEKAFGRKAA